jgi:hypothetical protein
MSPLREEEEPEVETLVAAAVEYAAAVAARTEVTLDPGGNATHRRVLRAQDALAKAAVAVAATASARLQERERQDTDLRAVLDAALGPVLDPKETP